MSDNNPNKKIIAVFWELFPHKAATVLIRSTALLLLMIGLHYVVRATHPIGWDVLLIEQLDRFINIFVFWMLFMQEVKNI